MYTNIVEGGLYELLAKAAKLAHPETGEWVWAVVYNNQDPDSPEYLRQFAVPLHRWNAEFRELTRADLR